MLVENLKNVLSAVRESRFFQAALFAISASLNMALLAACCFYGFKLVHYHLEVIKNPSMLEYREGAMLLSADIMADGVSPYDAENQPLYSNNYGALYPLLGVPVILISGPNLIYFRAISAVFIWLTLLLIAFVLIKKKVPVLYALSGTLALYAVLLYSTTPLVRPDSLGLFLFCVSIFLPYLYGYSRSSLLISVIAATLAFYAKPYFILGAPLLAIYLFLAGEWRKGFLYGISVGIFFTLTFLLIRFTQEFYFYNTVYVNIIAASNVGEYAVYQLNKLKDISKGFLLASALALLFIPYSFLVRKKKLFASQYKEALLPLFFLTVMTALMYLKLGRHLGAYMTYLFQLITPFLILSVLLLARPLKDSLLFKLPLTIFLAFTIYSGFAFLPGFHCENRKEWKELESMVKKNERILASPILSALLLENHRRIYDSGLTEYFQYPGSDNAVTSLFYNNEEKRKMLYENFRESAAEDVRAKNFDLIVFARGYERFVKADSLRNYYSLQKTIELCLPHTMQTWTLDIYEPKR